MRTTDTRNRSRPTSRRRSPRRRGALGGAGPVLEEVPGSRSATAADRRLPRGRHDLSREFVAYTQRDRLIDAMATAVEARGFGVTLTEVCAEAGVSTKHFYEHFADKEACFLATFNRGAMVLLSNVSTAYDGAQSWPSRIWRGLEMLLDLLASEPAFAYLAIVEMLAAGPRARELSRQSTQAFQRFFEDAPVRPGQQPVPAVVIEGVVAGVFGLLFNYISSKRTAELPALLPEVLYLVLTPFIGIRAAASTAEAARVARTRAAR